MSYRELNTEKRVMVITFFDKFMKPESYSQTKFLSDSIKHVFF